jgi:hypothetical protein
MTGNYESFLMLSRRPDWRTLLVLGVSEEGRVSRMASCDRLKGTEGSNADIPRPGFGAGVGANTVRKLLLVWIRLLNACLVCQWRRKPMDNTAQLRGRVRKKLNE